MNAFWSTLPSIVRPLRLFHIHCLEQNSKQAIINVQKKWIFWTASRSGCETLSHHRGLKDFEFQTGNSLVTLQKWSCEVWSCRTLVWKNIPACLYSNKLIEKKSDCWNTLIFSCKWIMGTHPTWILRIVSCKNDDKYWLGHGKLPRWSWLIA